jgi:hypothetical protein
VSTTSKRPLYLACAVALTMVLSSSSAGAVKLKVTEDTFLDLKLLLQPWLELKYDPVVAAPARQFTNDFFLRRTRVILGGQVTKWVSFFFDTDMPNWGRGGNWSLTTATKDATTGAVTGVKENSGFFIQDAWVSFDIHESIHITGGMLLLPFLHFSRQSAGNLHTLDYHVDLLRYPATGDKVWRSAGVELRGLLLKKKIDYRVAITNGVAHGAETIAGKPEKKDASGTVITPAVPAVLSNTKDSPRFTGRVAYNFFDAEEGFFLGGTYLGAKKILSVGFAFDAQPAVFGPSNAYYGLGGDIFLDYPINPKRRISGQLNFVYYGGEANPKRGFGMAMDIGFAFGKWEPVIGIDYYRPAGKSDLKDQLIGIHPGLNWWLFGHTANVKLDIGIVKAEGVEMSKPATGGNYGPAVVGTIQTQLLF